MADLLDAMADSLVSVAYSYSMLLATMPIKQVLVKRAQCLVMSIEICNISGSALALPM